MTALAASCTRVYMLHGAIAHLVPPDASLSGMPRAECGARPYQMRRWLGTGNRAEQVKAASLPLCGKCETAANSAGLPAEGTQR